MDRECKLHVVTGDEIINSSPTRGYYYDINHLRQMLPDLRKNFSLQAGQKLVFCDKNGKPICILTEKVGGYNEIIL